MAVNKVIYGGRTLVDLTADTVSAESLLNGVTAHNAAGELITGTGGAGSVLDIIGYCDRLISGAEMSRSAVRNISALTMYDGAFYALTGDDKWEAVFRTGRSSSVSCTLNICPRSLSLSSRESGLTASFAVIVSDTNYSAGLWAADKNAAFSVPGSFRYVTGTYMGSSDGEALGDLFLTYPPEVVGVHPAFAQYVRYNEKFRIPAYVKCRFKDLYALSGLQGETTGVLVTLEPGNSIWVYLFKDGRYPSLNYTTRRVDFGGNITFDRVAGLNLNLPCFSTSPVALAAGSQTLAPGYCGINEINQFYCNTQDIIDENGSVVYPKNCDVSDFI